MKRVKSKPEDERIVYDEMADPVDRSSAIEALGYDGYYQMEPLLASLLKHSNFLLRSTALIELLGRWRKEKYFSTAIEMLKNDSHFVVRGDAAFALESFVRNRKDGDEYKEKVKNKLFQSLMSDEDNFVQQKCYEELCNLLHASQSSQIKKREFNREQDVDWKLLQPYLDEWQKEVVAV